jgi:cytochrome c biogenesis protein CcmG, thiol:disulfide interchange protein DsbE
METDSAQIPETAPADPADDTTKGRSVWWKVLVWGGLFLLLGLLAFGLRRAQQGQVSPGEKVPNFNLTTFNGDQINYKDLEGKVVVVNFWASWCIPCEQEAAELQAAWTQYEPQRDVVFLGVDYVDTEPEAMAYLDKFGITYPNGPDLGTKISQSFRMTGVPETYIIDQEGILTYVKNGAFFSIEEIKSVIDPLLE